MLPQRGCGGIDHGCGGWSALFFAAPGMEVQLFGVVGFKIVVLAPRYRLKVGCRLIVTVLQQVFAMAPHLSAEEQDLVFSACTSGKSAVEIWSILAKRRRARGVAMMNVTAIRRFVRGKTHRRGKVETRGRRRIFTRKNVLAMDATRKKFIKRTKGAFRATWKGIRAKARMPKADATTVARAFQREGLDVKSRRPREKPPRTVEHEKERVDICGKMRFWPLKKFTEEIDMIMDNSKFQIPTKPDTREHLAKSKLFAQLRTRSEGLDPDFTKPSKTIHSRNLGGSAMVCAGISNCRIVLWEYCAKWNGQVAADTYKGPILKTLIKHRGRKASFLLAEDNDPTGYKSGKAMAEKRRLGIKTIQWPHYSPDLMPLDFSLWTDINRRMAATAPRGNETVAAFKRRLRRVALSTSTSTVRGAVAAMRGRAAMIWKAGGKNIARD